MRGYCWTMQRRRCDRFAAAQNILALLPAAADLSCDEVPQFGFAPGCQSKSNFVTLPESPRPCGGHDSDAGASDRDAGAR